MRIVLDPDEPGETVLNGTFYNGVIANAQYFGGGMHIAPDASMTDGVFDVVFLGNLTTGDCNRHPGFRRNAERNK